MSLHKSLYCSSHSKHPCLWLRYWSPSTHWILCCCRLENCDLDFRAVGQTQRTLLSDAHLQKMLEVMQNGILVLKGRGSLLGSLQRAWQRKEHSRFHKLNSSQFQLRNRYSLNPQITLFHTLEMSRLCQNSPTQCIFSSLPNGLTVVPQCLCCLPSCFLLCLLH